MIKFDKDKVLLLHQILVKETGGGDGVRDFGLLDSALAEAFSTFGDEEFYKTKQEKGASLGYSLVSNHAFVDGNKRIGVYVMLTFLEVNGIKIDATNEEIVTLGLSIADGKMKYQDVYEWIKLHDVTK
ncbi:MAG: type II toxin-antitoxin system death-on-curing family toxin [Bacillota bacterium]